MKTKIIIAMALLTLSFSITTKAAIGPIAIYLNTEYRTKTPVIPSIASTITINKQDIEETGVNTFIELLETIPSVSFEGGQGNLTALRIRGNEASHTLLLIDGMKVDYGGQANLDVIPLEQIERIEITKGPFSSLYGPGAIGGVVNIFTNKTPANDKNNKISLSYGTHNSKKTIISSNSNKNGNYLNFTFSKYHTDGIDATSNGDLDAIDNKSLSVNIGSKISTKANINFSFLKSDNNIQYDVIWGKEEPVNNLMQFNIAADYKFNKNTITKLSYIKQKTDNKGNLYKSNKLTVINEIDLNKNKLIIGMSNTIDKNIQNNTQIKHTDLFSQWQGTIATNEVSIGVRTIDHAKFSTHNTYNINLAKNINNNTKISLSFGKATNLPNHYQNNLNIINNKTDLKPEHSNSIELGLNWQNLKLKLYKSKVSNAFTWMDPTPLNSANADSYYINDGVVNIQGIEISAIKNIYDWKIKASYDYNKAIQVKTNKQQGRRPNHSANISATRAHGKYNYRINLIAKSWVWDTNNETNKIKGYVLLNLHAGYDYNDDIKLSISINNALNKKYTMAKGYNTLGRTINTGINYSF